MGDYSIYDFNDDVSFNTAFNWKNKSFMKYCNDLIEHRHELSRWRVIAYSIYYKHAIPFKQSWQHYNWNKSLYMQMGRQLFRGISWLSIDNHLKHLRIFILPI